jgi:flavin reductase (DIM6/NTAB) family NADH-FMN oxidoreductase RutF
MYYDPRLNNHNLPRDPFLATIVPRPIGWISTIGANGIVNLAPYSCFNAVSTQPPPFVMFASYGRKDSLRNAEATGEFVASMATFDLRKEVNATSAVVGPEVSEVDLARLEMTPSIAVGPPRVKRSPIAHECKYIKTVTLEDTEGQRHAGAIVIGQVVGIYIDDAILVDGLVEVGKVRPIARLGYMDYTFVEKTFRMARPQGEPS